MSIWSGPLCEGRVALVTGGAGAIGAASCRALAEHGADVVVVDIDAPRTEATVASVEALGRRALGVEVAPDGIRVNCIAVDKTRSYQVNFYEQPPEYDAHVPVWVPAGHLADADEVAAVVLFLASELSGWVVGQTIPADGGTLAAGGWYRTPNKWTNSPLLVQWLEPPAETDRRPPSFR